MEYWNTGRMEEWVIHKNKILVNHPAAELRGIKNQNSTVLGADTLCIDV
jgi:hypothetical protein